MFIIIQEAEREREREKEAENRKLCKIPHNHCSLTVTFRRRVEEEFFTFSIMKILGHSLSVQTERGA